MRRAAAKFVRCGAQACDPYQLSMPLPGGSHLNASCDGASLPVRSQNFEPRLQLEGLKSLFAGNEEFAQLRLGNAISRFVKLMLEAIFHLRVDFTRVIARSQYPIIRNTIRQERSRTQQQRS